MRIISGVYKGKRIIAPKNLSVRPTTDFAKESLFNILSNNIIFEETTLLDLFAGTGNISFEFISRGGKYAICVDNDWKCIRHINQIINLWKENSNISALKSDVFSFVEKSNQTYSLIFADPPYNIKLEELQRLISIAIEKTSPKGMLIIEHTKGIDLCNQAFFYEARRYGGCMFSFFKKQ